MKCRAIIASLVTLSGFASAEVAQIIAHRGASLERPECTLASIERAIEVGATAAEIDVRTSKDGQLYILHDTTLDRTTNGVGIASELTLAELQRLDAGSWFDERYKDERIPSLAEAARTGAGKIDLLLDLKEQGDDYDKQVASVIREHGDPNRTIVGVRSVEQAKRFRQLLAESKQLALIPNVDSIEAFADAGVEFIRLWARWLEKGDEPVRRVRATGAKLHLNGASGGFAETQALLKHKPDSLSSDNPRRQLETLVRIADCELPRKLSDLVEVSDSVRTEVRETGLGDRSFINRDYVMRNVPAVMEGLPRIAFDGGSGDSVTLKFKEVAVVFAVFDYNKTGAWSFADRQSANAHGWHRLGDAEYRGTSNEGSAPIWFREFKAGQQLLGAPAWWLCLGISDLATASEIDGFKPGLITAMPPPVLRYSHQARAAAVQPLHVPEFEDADAIRRWQDETREQFIERMLFPYEGSLEYTKGKTVANIDFQQEEFRVKLGGERLFRYFRLTPNLPNNESLPRPAIVCFMGHGKVSQVLADSDSYQHACAAEFARAGYIVFAMENVGMELGADTHQDLDQVLRLEGRGWYSLLFAHQRIVLDRVFADPSVDKTRVGVAGVSTGGLLALSAAATEPRIRAASVQGIFGSMRVSFIRDRNRHCSCGAIPGLLPEFDLPELALLVAPRALHISNGQEDGFPPAEAKRCLKLIDPIYLQAGG
ncbi:MAG: glycerophosphodiester phosphodiesterase family protein, partial [Verrucomicrobiota bacterium]